MAAQFKEVVIDTDTPDTQDPSPYRCQLMFQLILWLVTGFIGMNTSSVHQLRIIRVPPSQGPPVPDIREAAVLGDHEVQRPK